jgi:hypothetical protein
MMVPSSKTTGNLMSPALRAFTREMSLALLLVLVTVLCLRPPALNPSWATSLIFAVGLLAGQTLAIRALRHLLPSHLVNEA